MKAYDRLIKRIANWEKTGQEKQNQMLSEKGIDRYELGARAFMGLVFLMLVGGTMFIFSDDVFGWRVQVGMFFALMLCSAYWCYAYAVKPFRKPKKA